MPRIKFLQDFDYKPVPQQVYSYKAGNTALVTQEIADKAIEEGKAELTDIPTPPSGIKETIDKFPNKRSKKSLKESAKVEEIKEEQAVAELLEIASIDEKA